MMTLYDERDAQMRRYPRIIRPGLNLVLDRIKSWDQKERDSVDLFLAPSKHIQSLIRRYYHRNATILPPFVDTRAFTLRKEKKDYYLFVGRLVLPIKQADKVVEAFNRLGKQLIIVGDGYDRRLLERHAMKNIRFLGALPVEKLVPLFQNAKALILPSKEGFGMVSLEAQACGTPVIAYAKGGALETVIEGKTGRLFHNQTPKAIMQAVEDFERLTISPLECRKNALRFSKAKFIQQLNNIVRKEIKKSR